MSIKRVLIAAAGRGARLDRPGMPKPLVFVAGLPMILRTLVQCEEAGIEEAVVVVGYEAPTLVKALTLHPRLSKLKVRFAEAPRWQEEGLVASLLAARPLLGDERFVIAMGDHVFDGKLIEPDEAHSREPALAPQTTLAGGLYLPGDLVGNCRQFAHGLKAAAQERGVRFHFATAVYHGNAGTVGRGKQVKSDK